jgi:hypothetical protein
MHGCTAYGQALAAAGLAEVTDTVARGDTPTRGLRSWPPLTRRRPGQRGCARAASQPSSLMTWRSSRKASSTG